MQTTQRLDEYLSGLKQRLHWALYSRAGAIAAFALLLVLCGAIAWLAPQGFPRYGVIASRVVLAILIAAGAFFLWRSFKHLTDREGATALEQVLPQQQGRVQTYIELQTQKAAGASAPMLDLLAADALRVAQQSPIDEIVTPQRLWIASGVAATALIALIGMLTLGPSQWGYGSRHLLLGTTLPVEAVPVKQVSLQPGNKTLRRNADFVVQARVQGFRAADVQLFVRFADANSGDNAAGWERAAMQPAGGEDDASYLLTLYAMRDSFTYYALADGVKSAEYQVKVVDVPRIDSLSLRFEYPEWTGLVAKVETKSRDIAGVVDTQVQLTARASEPLDQPVLVLEESQEPMSIATNGEAMGTIKVSKPGRYHLSSRVAGELVALTDDYEISVIDDAEPTVEIVKPGRDWRASSVEEVPIVIRAQDDFRLQQLELRYSVNGGDWKTTKLPANTQRVEAKSMLQMEELGGKTPLVPGDLVSYYAVAKDRKHAVQTDLYMVQVQPFERRLTEGQSGGGAGDGSSEQEQIAERQRDILVATWNLQRARDQGRRTPQQLKESAEMLSGLQDKLSEQTTTLVERTRARTRGNSDPRVKQFLESLELAAKSMTPAIKQLSALELQQAVPNEQQALQMLLRAESAFRDIQVARQQDSQGGSGGRASRDISELYELEMDLAKNKYETEKEISDKPQSANQEVDAAIAKLKELAERQEKLAEQQRQQTEATNTDRWKQEQLRREAEELRRRLQEMAQQAQSQSQSQQGNSQGNSQGSESSQGSQQGSQQESQANIKQALQSVENALQAMRKAEAANQNNRGRDQNSTEQASRNLRQAATSIEQHNAQPQAGGAVEKLAEQATQLAAQQRQVEMDIYKAVTKGREQADQPRSRRDGLSASDAQKLADAKQQILKELEKLESNLRETVQSQRRQSPKTSERIGEIVDELSSANAQSRVARGIVDLERGRADQAVMSEGMITETLQNTASDLRNTVKLAGQESQQRADSVDPQALLSELAQLRRALQTAQAQQGQTQQGQSQQGQSQQGQSQQAQSQQGQSQQGQSQQGQAGQSEGQAQTAQSGQSQSGGGPNVRGPAFGGQPGIQRGALTGSSAPQQIGDGDGSRASNALRQQLTAIQNRIASGNLSQADLQALRNMIPQVRRLSADALTSNANLLQSLDRLELAALSAKEKAQKQTAARASAATASQDGESVAEYYRRLAK